MRVRLLRPAGNRKCPAIVQAGGGRKVVVECTVIQRRPKRPALLTPQTGNSESYLPRYFASIRRCAVLRQAREVGVEERVAALRCGGR